MNFAQNQKKKPSFRKISNVDAFNFSQKSFVSVYTKRQSKKIACNHEFKKQEAKKYVISNVRPQIFVPKTEDRKQENLKIEKKHSFPKKPITSINFQQGDPWNTLSQAILKERDPDEKNYWAVLRGSQPDKLVPGYQYKMSRNFPFQYVEKEKFEFEKKKVKVKAKIRSVSKRMSQIRTLKLALDEGRNIRSLAQQNSLKNQQQGKSENIIPSQIDELPKKDRLNLRMVEPSYESTSKRASTHKLTQKTYTSNPSTQPDSRQNSKSNTRELSHVNAKCNHANIGSLCFDLQKINEYTNSKNVQSSQEYCESDYFPVIEPEEKIKVRNEDRNRQRLSNLFIDDIDDDDEYLEDSLSASSYSEKPSFQKINKTQTMNKILKEYLTGKKDQQSYKQFVSYKAQKRRLNIQRNQMVIDKYKYDDSTKHTIIQCLDDLQLPVEDENKIGFFVEEVGYSVQKKLFHVSSKSNQFNALQNRSNRIDLNQL